MSDEQKGESKENQILEQYRAYQGLREEYSAEVANHLTSKNLERHGVAVTPSGVEAWHTINQAATQGRLDLPAEQAAAEGRAEQAAEQIMAGLGRGVSFVSHAEASGSEEFIDDEEDALDIEEEMDSLGDIFGYENDEDNEEAAYDHILKMSERAD